MSEMLSSSLWPNSTTSRQNVNDQFSMDVMNTWQPISQTDFYPIEDFNNVWSSKTDTSDNNEKESFIKSIWSSKASPSIASTETDSIGSADPKQLNETPINSPSLKRTEIINCNDRWGSVKINQLTPWTVVEIDESEKRPHDPMVWRAKVDGTEVWEDYYVKQHGRRRPQTDSSFNGDSVWSLSSDLAQSTSSIWPLNNNDTNIPSGDNYLQNTFTDLNNRPTFNTSNGVRPSMTRNQAQKYLIDMGYSLSDAIGALVNNQMDLPKAINELQSKYRISSNSASGTHNGMYTPTQPFNGRPGDSAVMGSRIPSASQSLNHMMGQTNSSLGSMMGSTYSGSNYDMFHSDLSDQPQMLDSSSYLGMDSNMPQYGQMMDTKRQCSMPVTRDCSSSFRSAFSSNALSSSGNAGDSGRGGMSSNCGQYNPDMCGLTQGMARMNIPYNNPNMMPQNGQYSNRWSSSGGGVTNGYGNMQPPQKNSNMMLNNNNNMDPRQNFPPGPANIPAMYGRSFAKQQMFQRSTANLGWYNDGAPPSPNGALNDMIQARLAKHISCPGGLPDANVGIIVRNVPPQHIESVKQICFEFSAMTNFQLKPQIQSIIVHFNVASEARRCMVMLQSQINARVELINDGYMY